MNTRFLSHAITTFLLVVTGALCTENALGAEITRVTLSAERTNFRSCDRTVATLLATVTATGPVGNVISQLIHSTRTISPTIRVLIDHAGSTVYFVIFERSGRETWSDEVFLRIIMPDGRSLASNRITLTGSCPMENSAFGSFRVTLTRFVVNHDTSEPIYLIDGAGDEVFALVNSAELGSNNNIIAPLQIHQSVIYGDTSGRGGRPGTVRAGTANRSTGGLKTGDPYPPPGETLPPPSLDRPRLIPMILWQGELRRGGAFPNAVVIIPTIWENDNNPDVFHEWNRQADNWIRQFAMHSAPLVVGAVRRPLVNGETVLSTIPHLINFDRPIAMDGDTFSPFAADPQPATFIPKIMFLTFNSAEQAASSTSNNSRGDRGVIEITYVDGRNYGQGSYTIFLLVERLP